MHNSISIVRESDIAGHDNHLMYMRFACKAASEHSRDPRTQNAALIVREDLNEMVSWGVNDLCHSLADLPERWERPAKNVYIEHAERNAIYSAAEKGMAVGNSTMYSLFAPCVECARAIIQSRISRLVVLKQLFDTAPEHWRQSLDEAVDLLKEAGVDVVMLDREIGVSIRFNGQTTNV